MRVLVVSWLSALSAATAASSSTTTNDVVHSNDDNCVLNADGVCENQGNTTPDDGNNSTENSAADADADNANDDHQIPFVWSNETSILDVLNPDVLNDRDIMDEIARRLRNHELVVIRDAFVPDFADFVWQDLNRDDLEWPAWEEIAQDGFSLSHSNFYWNDVSTTMREGRAHVQRECTASVRQYLRIWRNGCIFANLGVFWISALADFYDENE